MSFIVFLDVDGVLNSRNTVERSPDGYRGVDHLRVKVLADVINKYGGGELVITSDWKILASDDDYEYLANKLKEYGLSVSGKTDDEGPDRGKGVDEYLKTHPEIEEYVILDDNTFDYDDYPKLWERLLITDGIEKARPASKTPAVEAIIFMDYINEVG